MQRCSVLMAPGWTNSGPQHWQSEWERAHPEYQRIEQTDWDVPLRDIWVSTIDAAVRAATPPVILVAHSLGCHAVVDWALEAHRAISARVSGAFLVAPPDIEHEQAPDIFHHWRPIRRTRLPFPSIVLASRTDSYATFERVASFAESWGSPLVDLGNAGHVHTASGHGPWPEGHQMLEAFVDGVVWVRRPAR